MWSTIDQQCFGSKHNWHETDSDQTMLLDLNDQVAHLTDFNYSKEFFNKHVTLCSFTAFWTCDEMSINSHHYHISYVFWGKKASMSDSSALKSVQNKLKSVHAHTHLHPLAKQHTCTVCTPIGQCSYYLLIMDVPAPSKGFHLWWPVKILWLINNKIDCAKCSPRGQFLHPEKIPWYLFQESTVKDWMTDVSWRKWLWFKQLSQGISEYYFLCFLNNCHRHAK